MTLQQTLDSIDKRWKDFGYQILGVRPVENPQEDEASWMVDPVSMQPLFYDNLGTFRWSESLGDAIQEAQEYARKPRYLYVVVRVAAKKGFLSPGDVVVFKNGTVSYSNPRRFPAHDRQ